MARPHKWGRSQKYQNRPRYLYALLFNNGACYIGQSVNPEERVKQHRSPQGGWAGAQFKMVPLGIVMGTYEDAEHHEFAWRFKANKAGWFIYGKPGVFVDPYRRLTLKRRTIAWGLAWPKEHRRRLNVGTILAWLVGAPVAALIAWQVLT